jgi:serine/threonine protein kinase/tetratricopeptide (TPR) repeat protein
MSNHANQMSTQPDAPSQSLLIGSRYRLLRPLGAGGMGTVYRAVDRLTGDTVALKRVVTNMLQPFADPAVRLALTHEFQALASLRHPNIIAVRDYGFEPHPQAGALWARLGARRPYFTMDLLAEARTIIEAGQNQSVQGKLALLVPVLHALAYLHRRKIVHRDLKPGNVLVTQGVVKVLDFGLATAAGQMTPPSGTLVYSAPEVLRGEPANSTADLFSFGIIAYELLAGWRPFGDRPQEAIMGILHSDPEWAYLELDAPLITVLQHLLAKDPTDRYPNVDAVITALSEAAHYTLPVETIDTRESFLQAAPLVGRHAEVAQLTSMLEPGGAGKSTAWLIQGESGVGKSRLLSEVRTHALVQGAHVLRSQANSNNAGTYHLWRDLLRWLVLLADITDSEAAVLQPLVSDIGELCGRAIAPAPALEPKVAQTRLFTTIAELLRRAAGQQPLLCILEDIHWADANSIELLQWLLSRLVLRSEPDLPLYILGSYRPEEAPHLIKHLSAMQVLALKRLTAEQVAELGEAMLGPDGRREHLVRFLQHETEGNSFFVVEVLRALAQEAGHLGRVAGLALPAQIFAGGIQQVVQRRLERLPERHQPLLKLAAVAGRQLDLAVLGEFSQADILEEWLTLCANLLILEIQDGNWQFNHEKLRNAVISSLSTEQRPTLHLQIGQMIEVVHSHRLAPHYSSLAYHFGQAGDQPRQRQYLNLAGDAAQAAFANTAAVDAFEQLLALMDDGREAAETQPGGEDPLGAAAQPINRAEVLLRLGAVLQLTGKWEAAEAYFLQALSDSTRFGGATLQAQCCRALGSLYRTRGDFAVALEWLDQARLRYTPSPIPPGDQGAGLCEVLNEIGNLYYQKGDYDLARAHLNESLSLSRALAHTALVATALHSLGNVTFDQGDYLTTRALYEESLALRRQLNDKVGIASTLNNLGILASYQADYAATEAYYMESLAIRRLIGDRYNEAVSLNNLGIVAKEQGDQERALVLYEESLAIHQELGSKQGMAYARNNIAALVFTQGDYQKARLLFEQNLNERREINDRWGVASSLSSLGDVALAEDELAAAWEYYQQSLAMLRSIGDKQKIAYGLAGMASLVYRASEQIERHLLTAARLAGAVDALVAAHNLVMESHLQARFQTTVDALKGQLAGTVYQSAWMEGQIMTPESAIEYVLGLMPPETCSHALLNK